MLLVKVALAAAKIVWPIFYTWSILRCISECKIFV